MNKVLIIEDDNSIIDLLTINLIDIHCEVESTTFGKKGVELAVSNHYDLIILDIRLPDLNGVEVCKAIRSKLINTPIMMLTAESEEIDKIIGLETGADDYITKPFSVRELLTRIKVIFRRAEINRSDSQRTVSLISAGSIQIEVAKRKVLVNSVKIDLTPKEFDLLYLLIQNPGKSFSRDSLLNQVWGHNFTGYEHTVNSHINRLRAKIEEDHNDPKYILTSWGIGYRFTDEIKIDEKY